MTNTEILEKLMNRATEYNPASKESVNAQMVVEYLPKWDGAEPFPVNQLERYIRMNEWTYEDFNIETEMAIRQVLPDYVLDIFFNVKEFRENSRNELLSYQETFARLYGLPYNTQDEKALCVFKCAISRFLNNSEINKSK